MAQKKVVLIPHWIQEMLTRKGLPLATCLELPKIRSMLTLQDLMVFAALQRMSAQVIGARHVLVDELFDQWHSSIPAGDAESRALMDTLSQSLNEDDVTTRLLVPESKLDECEKPFITYDLSPTVCGVVIFPGYFVPGAHPELFLSLIESILKVLYVYDTYSVVAKTPLFARYLELLARR